MLAWSTASPSYGSKSNRSGLWRHILADLVVGWEDYVANVETMSHDMIKLQLSQRFCRATKYSIARNEFHVA